MEGEIKLRIMVMQNIPVTVVSVAYIHACVRVYVRARVCVVRGMEECRISMGVRA